MAVPSGGSAQQGSGQGHQVNFSGQPYVMSRDMLRDLRFSLHLLVKDRWYSAVAIVALSLGIGLNATVFTLVNAVLIRGLPFNDSGSLYMLGAPRQGESRGGGE